MCTGQFTIYKITIFMEFGTGNQQIFAKLLQTKTLKQSN